MCVSKRQRATLALLCLGFASVALGQQQATREQEQLRRLRLQIQQLQQEQSAQQQAVQSAAAEKEQIKLQLDAAQTQVRRSQSAAARASQRAKDLTELQQLLDTTRSERDALQAALQSSQNEVQTNALQTKALRADIDQGQRRLAARDDAFTALDARHNQQAQGLQTCIANNQDLQAVGHEVLQRYANKGWVETWAHNEPFLQISRVKLENLVQGYQDRLDQRALKPSVSEPRRAP